MKKLLLAAALGIAHTASAQVPYDPPTAVKAAPNVFLVLDATRTTMISGGPCGGGCHVEGYPDGGSGQDPNMYSHGETRLALARRVLTGGWGWNTAVSYAPAGGSADGFQRQDGIMDQYKVRWGVMYYDGLGARMVLNPTVDGAAKVAQKAVIDFGQPGFGENYGPVGQKITETGVLNSYIPYFRTLKQHTTSGPLTSNAWGGIPWWDAADRGPQNGSRQARALRFLRDYLHSAANQPQWTPPAGAGILALGPGVEPPNNANAIYNDPANVLNDTPPNGCRRNFTIMLLDGHGSGPIPTAAELAFRGGWDNGDQGVMPATIASQIYNMARNHAAWAAGPQIPEPNLRNQLFAIHFGHPGFLTYADTIADAGFDGIIGNGPPAYQGAPGGVMSDLSALYAAFASIFQLVLDGTYLGATPTVTRTGEVRVISRFEIQNCTQALPSQCNIGRIGRLSREVDIDNNGLFDDGGSVNFDAVLRSRVWSNRNIYTSYTSSNGNCNVITPGTCGAGATMSPISAASAPGNGTIPGIVGNDYDFMMGNPAAGFANGPARGDTRNSALLYFGTGGAARPLTDPYKLMDIANSRPVVVGAPTGIGEDILKWTNFLNTWFTRIGGLGSNGGDAGAFQVRTRDEVVYIGGNDGMLHAFLSRRHSNPPAPGRTTNYDVTTGIGNCAIDAASPATQGTQSNCLGIELWGYTPRMLHSYWTAIRGGHYFMVDGTPIVSDVLFTKRTSNPTTWDYHTVLLQCLGGGGPGCFALDVSNPYNPRLLWERTLATGVTLRQSTTSRPQIARMRRFVGGVGIPYYAALMGGGMGEAQGATPAGTFIALGLEDGLPSYSPTRANAPFAGAPTCLDTDNDSFTDTCYIATQEASIYKVRFPTGDPASMTMGLFFDARARLTALGLPGDTSIHSYSRVVATFDRNRDLRIYFGTGNFEDVQNTTEANYMFELLDPEPTDAPGLTAVVGANCGGGTGVYPLGPREKIIFDPLISNGVVLFSSFAPDPNPCLTGDGYLYGFTYDSCAPALDDDNDLLTPPVARIEYLDQGMPSAPFVNEHTGSISVALDDGTVLANTAQLQLAAELPVSKLWWRIAR